MHILWYMGHQQLNHHRNSGPITQTSSSTRTSRHPEQSKSFQKIYWRLSFADTVKNSPLIGQLKGAPRNVTGLVPAEFNRVITFQKEFIVSQGGEYFFTPAIKAIRVSPQSTHAALIHTNTNGLLS
jgi:hypothetical protein